jgi:uncharacterized protein (DUF983 family)
MGRLANFTEHTRNYVGQVLMDVWMYCPWCGVRQWFNYKDGNIYTCAHCKKELELKK